MKNKAKRRAGIVGYFKGKLMLYEFPENGIGTNKLMQATKTSAMSAQCSFICILSDLRTMQALLFIIKTGHNGSTKACFVV